MYEMHTNAKILLNVKYLYTVEYCSSSDYFWVPNVGSSGRSKIKIQLLIQLTGLVVMNKCHIFPHFAKYY